MKNITEVIFTTNKENNLDLESNFVYNFYITNERSINDNQISTTDSSKKYRYIELNLKNQVTSMSYSKDGEDSYGNILADEVKLAEKLIAYDSISNLIIGGEDYFFNKINNFDKEKAFYYNNTKNVNNEEKIKSYYNISVDDNNVSVINFIASNNKSFVKKSEIGLINDLENNHLFPSSNEINVYSNYDAIYNSDYYKKSYINNPYASLNSGIILNNFNKLFSLNIHTRPDKMITKCGFFIEKYKKINNVYEKISCKFKFFENDTSYSLNIKDEAVKYGETYLYTVSEVFIYRTKCLDGINLDYYLVCDYPFLTEDIECIEKRAPLCPNGPFLSYDKNKDNLKISWFPQSNDQNDVLGFQILKRTSLEEPFKVIAQIEGHRAEEDFLRKENIQSDSIIRSPGEIKTSYIDDLFDKEEISVYTVRSLDAHGNLSLYSSQVAAYYNLFEDTLITDRVSKENAPISKPNVFIPRKTIFFDNEDFTITNSPIINNKKTFSLYLTPDFVKLQDFEQDDENKFIFNEEYKFSLFNLDTYSVYEEDFEIENFNTDTDNT
jgi:hypothetical protein